MEKFELTILGCGSALPTTRHFSTSQVLNVRDKLYMIDCGEGAQIQFRRSKLKFSRLNHVFISHLHGDHCFGLPGLISTMGMLGRTATLHIHAPSDFEQMLNQQLEFFCKGLTYKVEFHPIDTKTYGLIHEDKSVSVYSIPLHHRIACGGFLFKEKATLCAKIFRRNLRAAGGSRPQDTPLPRTCQRNAENFYLCVWKGTSRGIYKRKRAESRLHALKKEWKKFLTAIDSPVNL